MLDTCCSTRTVYSPIIDTISTVMPLVKASATIIDAQPGTDVPEISLWPMTPTPSAKAMNEVARPAAEASLRGAGE